MPTTPNSYMTICNKLSLGSDHKLIHFSFRPSALWQNMFRYFLNSSILLPESYSASVKSPPTQMKTISNTNSDMSVVIHNIWFQHWSLVSKHQTITATMNSGQTRLSKQWIIASVVTASGEELQAPPKNAMMARLPTNLSPYKTTGIPTTTIHMTCILLPCRDSTLRENNSHHKEDPLWPHHLPIILTPQ